MSHSKFTKRGYSLYVERWNPYAKNFINTCKICGGRGYSPAIEEKDFCRSPENKAIYAELTKILKKLELDKFGRCENCARLLDES